MQFVYYGYNDWAELAGAIPLKCPSNTIQAKLHRGTLSTWFITIRGCRKKAPQPLWGVGNNFCTEFCWGQNQHWMDVSNVALLKCRLLTRKSQKHVDNGQYHRWIKSWRCDARMKAKSSKFPVLCQEGDGDNCCWWMYAVWYHLTRR